MAEYLRGRRMRDLALAILGRNAQKQLERGVPCTPAQAHHLIHHDQVAEHLLPHVVAYLERMLSFAQGRLGAAEDDLRSIRLERMDARAARRRVEGHRKAPEMDDQALPGLFDGWPRKPSVDE